MQTPCRTTPILQDETKHFENSHYTWAQLAVALERLPIFASDRPWSTLTNNQAHVDHQDHSLQSHQSTRPTWSKTCTHARGTLANAGGTCTHLANLMVKPDTCLTTPRNRNRNPTSRPPIASTKPTWLMRAHNSPTVEDPATLTPPTNVENRHQGLLAWRRGPL